MNMCLGGGNRKNKHILLTGVPGVGKSTLLKKIIDNYTGSKVGIMTSAILKDGRRHNFNVETSSGCDGIIASVDFHSSRKVGKYGVNIQNLDKCLPSISDFDKDDLLYLDEIGTMQLYSSDFKKLALKYIDSSNRLIGTIKKRSDDEFITLIKKRDDVEIIDVTRQNRVILFDKISAEIY